MSLSSRQQAMRQQAVKRSSLSIDLWALLTLCQICLSSLSSLYTFQKASSVACFSDAWESAAQEKKPAPEENGSAVHTAEAAGPAAAAPAGPTEDEVEAWRHADPYAFLPSPSENNKVRHFLLA